MLDVVLPDLFRKSKIFLFTIANRLPVAVVSVSPPETGFTPGTIPPIFTV